LVEADADFTCPEGDALRKPFQRDVHPFRGSFHQQARAFYSPFMKRGERLGELLATALFVDGRFAGGELLEVLDEALAVGDAVAADLVGDAGLEDLLGAAAADAEELLQGGAVDPRVGKAFELVEDSR
jgi:hypothetical protein